LSKILVQAVNLTKYFNISKGILFKKVYGQVKAVDRVNLSIVQGTVFGLVGESGSGKTTLARLLTGIIQPDHGEVFFDSQNLKNVRGSILKQIRKDIGFVYQDPYSSLDPRKKVYDIVAEPLKIHNYYGSIKERVNELLTTVGLRPEDAYKYPHMFSGGQRQRIAIARALALSPKFLVCDEPTSSLDVSAQAKILNLLKDLKKIFGLTILIISHDLSVVRQLSDTVAVMYSGKVVELGNVDSVLLSPLHPYTKALIHSIPIPDPHTMKNRKNNNYNFETHSLFPPILGCLYRNRCPYATEKCTKMEPEFLQVKNDHYVSCHNWQYIDQK